jgi:uncharacterized protein (DUF1684 family)
MNQDMSAGPSGDDAEAHRAAVSAHRARRDARYRAEDGWLTLVDRIDLDDGAGELPIGRIELVAGRTPRLSPAPGVTRGGQPVTTPLDLDLDDARPFELGGRRYHVGRRGGRPVVRVRDPQAPARVGFRGIPFFDVDPTYRVVAEVTPIDPPRIELVGTTDGGEDELPCIGEARFTLAGVAQRLGVFAESGGKLVVPFTDPTNRESSYGGGRMLYVERPAAGGPWVIDFNLAFNPPCAFNSLVACPLPPAMNRLTVPVPVGERRPA